MLHRFSVPFLLLALPGCHGEESSKNVDIPGSLRPYYEMQSLAALPGGPLSDTLELKASFQSGPDYVIFDQGEALSVEGVPMTRSNEEFTATMPAADEPAEFVFRLDVPDKGSFESTIRFAMPGTMSAPEDGAMVSADDDLTVTWSNTDPIYGDTVFLDFELNAGVGTAPHVEVYAAGATSVTIDGSTIRDAYDAAAVDPGPVTLHVSVGRFSYDHPDDVAPYEAIQLWSDRTLGIANLTVMP